MKRAVLLLGSVLFGLTVFRPVTANALSVTLDNPNQTVAIPSSGVVTLDFTGTVTLDSGFILQSIIVDDPFNSAQTNFLVSSNNFSFFGGSGLIFQVAVPAGQLPDLYDTYTFGGSSSLRVTEVSAGAGNPEEVDVPFSVLVTAGTGGNNGNGGNGVPDGGSSAALLGLSLVGLAAAGAQRGAPCAEVRRLKFADRRSKSGVGSHGSGVRGSKRSTLNVQRSTFNVQRSTLNAQRSTSRLRKDYAPASASRMCPGCRLPHGGMIREQALNDLEENKHAS